MRAPVLPLVSLALVGLLSTTAAADAPAKGDAVADPAEDAESASAAADAEGSAQAEPTALAEAGAEAEAEPEGAEPSEGEQLRAAVMARLDAANADALDAMDDTQLEALFERVRSGRASAQDEAIATAFGDVWSEAFEAGLQYQTGDITLPGGLAVLHLGDELRYLDPQQAEAVLVDAWGNPPGAETLGMIVPANTSPLAEPERRWAVVITFADDGYVDDDDAEDLDYDELLSQMKQDAEQGNASRRAQGYEAVHLIGWAEPPHYDADAHRLYWAQELDFEGSPRHTLNYAIRVLGRRGVLELNAVGGIDQLPEIGPQMEDVLSRVEFSSGHRYEDFDPDLDQVAAYGIGGLIAGKVLAKAGIFAGLLKFLVAAKKLLIVFVIGIGVAIKKLVGRRREDEA